MSKRKLHLSASSIAAYKACPINFRNAYVLGIRPDRDSEAQRVGTNWHRLLEIMSRKPGSVCPECAPGDHNDPGCPLCDGTGFLPDDIMVAVTRELNRMYADKDYLDAETVEVERTKLIYMLHGYRWKYDMDDPEVEQEKVITREQRFEMTLRNPETGHTLPGVRLVGMIDKIIATHGILAIKEHKSTSNSLDTDSDYWGHLALDTQTNLYLYIARRMQLDGLLEPWGIGASSPLINTIYYDVMHKPAIKPKKLSQADSKKFVADGMYYGQKFEFDPGDLLANGLEVKVNGTIAVIEPGAKEGTFAIRETPEMYGARLLADIGERPDFYYRSVPLTRTDADMEAFEWELFNIYRTMQTMIRTGHWYSNEHHCEAKYKCDYISVCYNRSEISEECIPEGMKSIFKKEGKKDGSKTTA